MKKRFSFPLVKIIRRHFVYRMVLLCIITDLAIVTLLNFAVYRRVGDELRRQASYAGRQTLDAIESYFAADYENLKHMNYELYADTATRQRISQFFEDYAEQPPSAITEFQQFMLGRYRQTTTGNTALVGINLSHLVSGSSYTILEAGASQSRTAYYQPMLELARSRAERAKTTQFRAYECMTIKRDAEGRYMGGTLSLFDYIRTAEHLTTVSGILSVHYDLARIDADMERLLEDTGGTIYLVSGEGTLLYASDCDYSKTGEEILARQYAAGKSSEGLYADTENTRFGFTVLYSVPRRELYAAVYEITLFMAGMLALALVLLAVLTVLYARRLSRRVHTMVDSIGRIDEGQLEMMLPETKNGDELDCLSHSVNNMQRRLQLQLQQKQEAEQRQKQAILQQKDAELYALQSQINPHFLYNMLEIIRMKALSEAAMDTATMIRLLAELFRRNVGRKTIATVGEELDYCASYAELFSLRHTSGIDILMDVQPGVREYALPNHILQPIVENAFVHGLTEDSEDAMLHICVRYEHGGLMFEIRDNGRGMTEQELCELRAKMCDYTIGPQKVGLANVNQRIRLLFGPEYGLTVSSTVGQGTTIQMHLPAVSREELEKRV